MEKECWEYEADAVDLADLVAFGIARCFGGALEILGPGSVLLG